MQQSYPTPDKLLDAMKSDPYYQDCMLKGLHGHICGGRKNTKDHSIKWTGHRLNVYWAITSVCAKGHGVDEYQDAHTEERELITWVALNRATDAELRAISKATDYIRERDRLNSIYGKYVMPIFPPQLQESGINY